MGEFDESALDGDLVGKRSLVEGPGLQSGAHPGNRIWVQDNSPSFGKQQGFPDCNGGHSKLDIGLLQNLREGAG